MKAPITLRVFFAFLSCMLWAGIFLTGFNTVSWVLYLPACVSLFAAVTGICPSMVAIGKLMTPRKK